MSDFLLELGLEEIPARMIAGAEAELGRRVEDLLRREKFLRGDSTVTTYSTPRRLAVRIEDILSQQEDFREELVGPPRQIAYKDGVATQAAIAFAKKAGVEVGELGSVITDKGTYLAASVTRKGRTACELLAAELPKEILGLYWAKNMYWRAGKLERLVRPLRWLVAMLDSEVIPLEIAGIKAGNVSRGHRILHGDLPIEIGVPSGYLDALKAAYVQPDVGVRRHIIRKALDRVTRAIQQTPEARWREDEELIESVVHLTEWPTVLYGTFESEYLALPEEVLVTVMRDHQKYFAVEDSNGKLAPHFLTVLNTQVDAEGEAIIRHGNERVLRSRFKDAQFFWETDQKIPLTERVEMLKSVTFQKELGSYWTKMSRMMQVAHELNAFLEKRDFQKYSYAKLEKAIELAKTDLTAELVKEFTELQGIIGGHYARAQGLDEAIAAAIYSQYMPASAEGPIPTTIEGQLLGIVDRIQTISAMFEIGNAPTGSKDPFALRRGANAIVKILAESELPLRVTDVVNAGSLDVSQSAANKQSVTAFLTERLNFYLRDSRGFAYDVVAAVLAADADDVRDAIARAEALTAVRGSDDFLAIAAAFKRIKNILRQAQEKGELIVTTATAGQALNQPEELALQAESSKLAAKVTELRRHRNYREALEAIATLRPTVDAFFDKVMVMAPEPELRNARLALIQSVLDGFAGIADFSEIVIA